MSTIYESDIEKFVIELFQSQGRTFLEVEQREELRGQDYTQSLLLPKLQEAINRLNPAIPEHARQDGYKHFIGLDTRNLSESNELFHQMMTEWIPVEYQKNTDTVGDRVKVIDFLHPENNEYNVVNQYTMMHGNVIKRPDVILLINGIPLVVIELKNPEDQEATLEKAYQQLQTYKQTIPNLMLYNAVLVVSDGLDAKAGSLTAPWSRCMERKSKDGNKEANHLIPQIEILIHGMLDRHILLDLIRYFTVFEKEEIKNKAGQIITTTIKKIAAYHQYYAVNKAIEQSLRATQAEGDRKIGVVRHTQGSGKSLSMVFYTGKIVQALDNPTVVVMTDRNDLDDQLFSTFAWCQQILRQAPVQAESRDHIKKLLQTNGGGIIFTTIQKFSPEWTNEKFDCLSERKNIVVIADEAHRSQYGFGAKTMMKNDEAFTKYGFAKYLRDALPNASFIGFTGTPIEKEDASTPAVFGNYIDVYDIQQAVTDGATVPIYYESRLVKLKLKEDEMKLLDEKMLELTEGEEMSLTQEKKLRWTKLEAIVGHPDRLATIAKDIIEHFEARCQAMAGKGMIVTMSRRIAVDLFQEIVTSHPDRRDDDLNKWAIKIVMTSASSDPLAWQVHHTSKQQRKELALRLKDPNDPLKLVIVCDMRLTGFDAPCLHTMYIDKLMRGHTLMQAIARVNRVYKDKPGWLIVDYIGIGSDLKEALAVYTESGGEGKPTFDQADAIAQMKEKYEIVEWIFAKFDYKPYFTADTRGKMWIILSAQDYILWLDNGAKRFVDQVNLLSQSFALSVPSLPAMEIKEEVAFFQAIKARLSKFTSSTTDEKNKLIETTIKQMIDNAVQVEGVMDIFAVAWLEKPNISILSDEFLAEVRDMEHKNVALELLKKILRDEISKRGKKNIVQSKKLSEMLQQVINKYHNNLITTAQIIEELINIAKEINAADAKNKETWLTDDEIAFYDALASNQSAQDVLGDKQLRTIAKVLVQKVKANTAIDRQIKESAQAKLRVIVKRILNEFGYPPDQAKITTELILLQTKVLAEERSEEK